MTEQLALPCCHRWQCSSPNGPGGTPAVCRWCGMERVFRPSIESEQAEYAPSLRARGGNAKGQLSRRAESIESRLVSGLRWIGYSESIAR